MFQFQCHLESQRPPLLLSSTPLRPFSVSLTVLGFPRRRAAARVCCCSGVGDGHGAKLQQRRAYPFYEIEPWWQQYWEESRTFRTPDEDLDTSKPKCYILDMFPYPSHPKQIIEAFVLLLSTFAPHMAEELWFLLGHTSSLAYEPFLEVRSEYLNDTSVVLPVQINGKTQGTILVDEKCSENEAFKLASIDERLPKYLLGKTIKKEFMYLEEY